MKIVFGELDQKSAVIAFVFDGQSTPCGLNQKEWVDIAKTQGFKASAGSTVVVHPQNQTVILAGLGAREKCDAEGVRRVSAAAVKKLQSLSIKDVCVVFTESLEENEIEFSALVEGILLADYKFLKYKSDSKNENALNKVTIVCDQKNKSGYQKLLPKIVSACDAVCAVRNWVNEPPSSFTPKDFAAQAKKVVAQNKEISITIYEKPALEKMKMGGLLGVARGSSQSPLLIHLKYSPKNVKRKVALIGKGVTFDSGGLSLKPAASMETMKMDMAGAASVLGVFMALSVWKPNVAVDGVLALTENMTGCSAYKPGDVLVARNGKTIEVLNTDAEGRLILADALCYAAEQKPDEMIDLATLTGACLVALGSKICGAMTNTEDLYERLDLAAQYSGEKFWQLPLEEDYRDYMKSPLADLQNISNVRGEAGTITAGLFLQAFVGDVPWMHLDIAGPAWTDRGLDYCPRGGTGFAVRTLLNYLSLQ